MVKAKATLERKTMREAIFVGLKWYAASAENSGAPRKKIAGKAKMRNGFPGTLSLKK